MLQKRDDPARLIAGEPEAVHVQATYTAGQGWTVDIGVRRQFQGWGEADRYTDEFMTTPELVTTIDAVICHSLRV